jgi:folylpolyglutamate synthase/dihydropteroate synthase
VLLCSALKTKDIKSMAKQYSGFADFVFLTKAPHPLAASKKELEDVFGIFYKEYAYHESIKEASVRSLEKAKKEDAWLVISGSFYIINDIKNALGLDKTN